MLVDTTLICFSMRRSEERAELRAGVSDIGMRSATAPALRPIAGVAGDQGAQDRGPIPAIAASHRLVLQHGRHHGVDPAAGPPPTGLATALFFPWPGAR